MPSVELPMELWARVASFLPFSMLMDTFWALRHAGLLPDTGTHASNAFLQFCAEVSCEEDEEAHYEIPLDMRVILLEMGFDNALIDYSVQLCRGRHEAVYDYLIHTALEPAA